MEAFAVIVINWLVKNVLLYTPSQNFAEIM